MSYVITPSSTWALLMVAGYQASVTPHFTNTRPPSLNPPPGARARAGAGVVGRRGVGEASCCGWISRHRPSEVAATRVRWGYGAPSPGPGAIPSPSPGVGAVAGRVGAREGTGPAPWYRSSLRGPPMVLPGPGRAGHGYVGERGE